MHLDDAGPPWVRRHADRVEVTLLGGRAVLGSGACGTFRTGARFASLFSPTPTEPVQVVRPGSVPSTLGVEGIDGSGEPLTRDDLNAVGRSWARYTASRCQ